ncbi:MAG: sigma-54-dependent Fis family transcriptional regulator [Pontiellaceae bacterium]|nr:sigma-54-dependent Fis family transcriptional regulator [Pontiellaceae bacterium]
MDMVFFRKIAVAAFSNPFTDQRVEADRQVLGAAEGTKWSDLLTPLLQALEEKINELEREGGLTVQPEGSEDERALAVGVLFHVFHRYLDRFDQLIVQQLAVGEDSCEAPFARQCMDELMGYGFKRAEACRYVAMFYQIRRAFYFISEELVGESECMKQFRARLWDNIFTHDIFWYDQCLWDRMEDFSTLLLGETGTGKGAAASAIGRSGFIPFNPNTQRFEESFTRAFVSINLSQYPETLIESELFGHRKGAFTGAIEKHDGIFSRCSPHGAIFLDEIGDVSVPIQIKLLQVLQERTFSPVGSHDKLRFQGRVIAATNKPMDQLRREGHFRDDFYYRLCSDLITVPPLRQRLHESAKELDRLVNHLVQRICGSRQGVPVLSILKRDVGIDYPWPGNVRELEQAIRRVVLTGAYAGDSTAKSVENKPLDRAIAEGSLTAKALVEKYCRDLYGLYGNYGEVARRTGLDWRTVKKNVGR